MISQDVSHQLKVINTRLSELEKEKSSIETSDDNAMPKFRFDTLHDFDIFVDKLNEKAFVSLNVKIKSLQHLYSFLKRRKIKGLGERISKMWFLGETGPILDTVPC